MGWWLAGRLAEWLGHWLGDSLRGRLGGSVAGRFAEVGVVAGDGLTAALTSGWSAECLNGWPLGGWVVWCLGWAAVLGLVLAGWRGGWAAKWVAAWLAGSLSG